jgi:hypothetical protein
MFALPPSFGDRARRTSGQGTADRGASVETVLTGQNQGGKNENVSNNLLDPSGHLRTFVGRCGSKLAPRRWNDQSIEFGSAITGYDRRVSNLGLRFCHGRTAAVMGEPSLRHKGTSPLGANLLLQQG